MALLVLCLAYEAQGTSSGHGAFHSGKAGTYRRSLDFDRAGASTSRGVRGRKKLLDNRWEKFLANPDSALTLEQVKALLAARRK